MYLSVINNKAMKGCSLNTASKLHKQTMKSPTKILKKTCSICDKEKPLSAYYINKANKEGLQNICKVCDRKIATGYRRTFKGLVGQIYSDQKKNSKTRRHPLPNYTKQELSVWMESHFYCEILFDNWVSSEYNKNLTPSVDRNDDYLPYTLSNLNPLTTWGKHIKKTHSDRKNGINNKISKAVIGVNIKTGESVEFHSVREAERELGISNSNISAVCQSKKKKAGNGAWYLSQSAGGYNWKFKN